MNRLKLLSILLLTALTRCATVTNPDGGPKDEKPPVLLSTNPRQNQTNFSGSTIELTFTEAIQLKDPKEQIIIIPSVGKRTTFLAKRNKLEIKPEKPWQPNTTYSIKFRESIQDITEGNPIKNLTLAFSTGNYIDSLSISGTIRESLSELIPETITVAVFNTDTFNIFKHIPIYFTQTNKDGKFTITNLKPDTYRLYAFYDKNKNLALESKSEKFGFKSQPIKLHKNKDSVTIALVSLDSRPIKLTTVRQQSDINTIRINKAVTDYTITTTKTITHSFGTDQTEIIAHYPKDDTDSTAIQFTAIDSLQQKIDTTFYLKKTDAERIKESFTSSFTEQPKYTNETSIFTFSIKHNKPILHINTDSINLDLDTINTTPIKRRNLHIDTKHKTITYQDTLSKLPTTAKIKLRLGKGALISLHNDSTKAEEKLVQHLTPESTAILLVQVKTTAKNYIVQVLSTANQVLATSYSKPKITFKNLNPETVKVRVITDVNGNGIWDTANYITNAEPEPVTYYINSDKKYETPLRANWEVGPLVISF